MKKFLITIMITMAVSLVSVFGIVLAADTPIYDATFDDNAGALFANGTPVVIDEDSSGNTVVSWDGGSQIIPSTASVFGGGREGTSYTSSSIIMNGGILGALYGGGASLDGNQVANIGTSNIAVNGGTVLASVNGGGLLYTTVNTSNVVINDGRIAAVEGGGIASAVVSGVEYSTGTEDNAINSQTRVNNANVTVNGGIIDSTPSAFGLVYGGGQGYSYTGNANLTINGGDMSNAFVTSGGSNGYTGNATTRITGGNINVFQTVNRGSVNTADVRITGGTIENAYVGGETGDPTVTGTIDTVDFNTLGGTIQNLSPGTSGGQPITIDPNNYTTVTAPGTVVNNNIGPTDIDITVELDILEDDINLPVGSTRQLTTRITTTPTGYENLYEEVPITWTSSDPAIATVDQNGVVTAVSEGTVTITATLLDQTATTEVNVIPEEVPTPIAIIIFSIILLALVAFLICRIFM